MIKKRKNYDRWIHYSSFKNKPELPNTLCGKTARRIEYTCDQNNVTCKRCLELMKRGFAIG